MLRIALLGESYVKKFGRFYDGFLGVHVECRFYGVGGMRADRMGQRVGCELIEFHTETVCVSRWKRHQYEFLSTTDFSGCYRSSKHSY